MRDMLSVVLWCAAGLAWAVALVCLALVLVARWRRPRFPPVVLDPSLPVTIDVSGLGERNEHGQFLRKPSLQDVLRAARQQQEGGDDAKP